MTHFQCGVGTKRCVIVSLVLNIYNPGIAIPITSGGCLVPEADSTSLQRETYQVES